MTSCVDHMHDRPLRRTARGTSSMRNLPFRRLAPLAMGIVAALSMHPWLDSPAAAQVPPAQPPAVQAAPVQAPPVQAPPGQAPSVQSPPAPVEPATDVTISWEVRNRF